MNIQQENRARLNTEIHEKLDGVRKAIDEKPNHHRLLDLLTTTETQRVYGGILKHQPIAQNAETGNASGRLSIANTDGGDDIRSARSESTAYLTPQPSFRFEADTRKELLQQVDQQLSSWIEGIDAITAHSPDSKAMLDLQGVIKRYFRPGADRLMTNEVKMGAGMGDVFAGVHSLGEHLETIERLGEHPTQVLAGLAGGALIGSTLLLLAGAEGMHQGAADALRLKRLVKPLKAYRNALVDLQKELKKSPGADAATELISMNLQGVEARLRAAKHQLSDSLMELGISGIHTTVGGIGIAEGATAAAGAATAAKVLGAAYGGVVAAFGMITAAKSGLRWSELDKLATAVKEKLPEGDPLRQVLLDLIRHERSTRKHEVATRVAMGAAGATSLGLQVAGLAGAVPSGGASIGLAVAGATMGAATAASFNPIKSRQRALNAIGGVERTTHMPATFLFEPGHLHSLLDKVNEEGKMVSSIRRQIIDGRSDTQAAEGTGRFRYTYRAHRVLAKVIPSADRRALANKIVSSPEAVAKPLMTFMQQATDLERKYLQEHKVPILQREVELLLSELERPDGEAGGKHLLAQQIRIKAETLRATSVRLEHLQDLEIRLDEFAGKVDTGFLSNQNLKRSWEDLQVDFIVSHDMVPEALSKGSLKRVQKQLAAQVDSDAESRPDVLRDALRKNVGTRLARVFAHSYPERVDYERRGVIEVALAMFVEGKDRQAPADAHDHLTPAAASSTAPA